MTVLAVRGLTELVVTSYTEDQYGVVQAVSVCVCVSVHACV